MFYEKINLEKVLLDAAFATEFDGSTLAIIAFSSLIIIGLMIFLEKAHMKNRYSKKMTSIIEI